MADQKISQLPTITGANMADNDKFVLVDTSGDATVATTRAEFFNSVPEVTFGDGIKANFGNGSDLQISHDGNNSIIDEVGTGNLFIRATNINFQNRDSDPTEQMITAVANGAVTLYQNGDPKLATTSAGIAVTGTSALGGDTTVTGLLSVSRPTSGYGAVEVGGSSGGLIDLKAPFSDDYDARIIYNGGTDLQIITLAADEPIILKQGNSTRLSTSSTGISVTGNATFADNGKAIFGDGSDLQIYHDGSNSYVTDTGAGDLIIASNGNAIRLKGTSGENMIVADTDSSAKLFYDGTEILATSSAGINVTGTVTSDGLTVSAGAGDGIFLEDDSNSGSSPFIKARGKRSDGNDSQSFGGKLLLDGHRTDAAVANGKNLGTVAFGGNHTNGTDTNILYSASISGVSEGTFSNATTMPTALVFYTGSTGRADNTPNVTSGDEAMRIDSDGKIGIGTSSPDTLMELVGANPILTIRDTDTGIATNDARLRLAESGASSSLDNYFDLMYNVDKFRISSNTVANAFAIDRATGKVGISQPAPAALLHVGDDSNVLGTTSGNSLSNFTLQTDTTNVDSLLFTTRRTADGNTWTTATHRIQRKVDNVLMGYMQFGSNATDLVTFGETNSEYARIDGGGAFHVGRTTNDFTDPGFSTTQAGLTTICRSDDLVLLLNRHTANDGQIVQFRRNNATVGSINVSAGATSYLTSSDYRLKENVVGLTGASARVNQLKPSQFNFISDETNTLVDGFLAHEVATVVPEAITGTKDAMMDEEYEITPEVLDEGGFEVVTEAVMGTRSVPDYQGIDQSKLVPLLTAALQEALAEIASLKTRVEALEG